MRITRIKLTDFGPHKSVDFDCDGSVVGILGKNGSGKSNILKGVKYCLTGKLEGSENLESFIRGGAKKAVAEVWFKKDGQAGYIRRNIGGTQKKVLQWDGNEITSNKDIESVMEGILGCDLKSVSSASFIGQGDLSKLLFGGANDREALFIRLTGMSFCEQRERAIGAFCDKLSKDVPDLGPARDEAASAVTLSTTEVNHLEKEKAELKDWRPTLKLIDSLEHKTSLYSTESERLGILGGQLRGYEKTVKELLTKYEFGSIEDITYRMENMSEDIREMETEKHESENTINLLEHYTSITQNWSELMRERQELKKNLPNGDSEESVNRAIEDGRALIQDRKTAIINFRAVEEVKQTIQNLIKRQDLIQKELGDLRPPEDVTLDDIEASRKEVDNLKLEEASLRGWINTQREIMKCAGRENNSQCSKCGLNLEGGQDIKEEDIAKLDARLNEVYQKRSKLEAETNQKSKDFRDYENKYNNARSRVEVVKGDLHENMIKFSTMPQPAKGSSIEQLEKEQEEVQTKINGYEQTFKQVQALTRKIDATQVEFQEMTRKHPNLTGNDREALQKRINDLKPQIDSLVDKKNQLHAGWTVLNMAVKNVENVKYQVKTCQETIKFAGEEIDRLTDQIQSMRQESDVDVKKVRVELESEQEQFDQVAGRLAQAQTNLDQAQARLNRIQERIRQNANTQEIVEKLKKLKSIFHKSGLPTAVNNYRFDQIAAMTGQNLETMNVNLSLLPSETNYLSFDFVKHTDEEQSLLAMEKMSGGERVRASIAFLLAVQQILLPGLGVMSLDEPSTHQDEEGVESIMALLSSIPNGMLGDEGQLFLIDHDPKMEVVMEKLIRL